MKSNKSKSECVKVAIRVRPMNKKELEENSEICVDVDKENNTVSCTNSKKHETKTFQFDFVYPMDSTQREVYDQVAFPIVDSIFQGYNGTVFAYGQTGCGKTYTMMGITDDPIKRGVIPNAFEHIFGYIKNEGGNKKFLVRCSFVEIYNEEVRDLLGKTDVKLDIREDPKKGTFIKDLVYITLAGTDDIQRALNKGNNNRHVGATSMNDQSSRSHSLFTVYLEIQEGEGNNKKIRSGKLNLVDLAGSERVGKTNATGKTFDEGKKINLSLTALGSVIDALSSNRKHIPYKDSKLTRLLADSLGGNTKTVMFANVSPASYNYEETVGTLRYASRAKLIKNAPKINEDPKDALLRQMEDEIKRLKEQLAGGQIDVPVDMPVKKILLKKESKEMDEDEKNMLLKKIAELEKGMLKSEEEKMETIEEEYDDNNEHKLTKEEFERLKKEHEIEKKKFKEYRENQLKQAKEMEEKYLKLEEEKQKKEESLQNNVNKLLEQIKFLSDEIEDLRFDNLCNRNDYMENIKGIHKDNLLYREIIRHLLTDNEYRKIIDKSKYIDEDEKWKIQPFQIEEKKLSLKNVQPYQIQTFIENNISKRELFLDDNLFDEDDYYNPIPLRESRKNIKIYAKKKIFSNYGDEFDDVEDDNNNINYDNNNEEDDNKYNNNNKINNKFKFKKKGVIFGKKDSYKINPNLNSMGIKTNTNSNFLLNQKELERFEALSNTNTSSNYNFNNNINNNNNNIFSDGEINSQISSRTSYNYLGNKPFKFGKKIKLEPIYCIGMKTSDAKNYNKIESKFKASLDFNNHNNNNNNHNHNNNILSNIIEGINENESIISN